MKLSFIDCGMVSCSVSLWAVLGTFAVIFFLSPRGFQLPTFCAGWGSSTLSLLGCFNCQPFVLVGSQLLTVLCWLVLIRCNLLSLSSGVSAVILFVHEYFSAEIFLSPAILSGSWPTAAWPLPPRQSQQSVSTFML